MNDEIQTLDTSAPIENSTYTSYEKINFENGTLVSPGSVNLETGELTMPMYSGKAPINAQNLNHIEDGIKNLENYVLVNGGGSGSGSEAVGTVKAYAGPIIPDGYLLCDGRQILKSEYKELFTVLGTTYNLSTDTDSTKFRIPDLRGRVVVGVGSFDTTHLFTLGEKAGEYEHLLTINEMPKHEHQGTVDTTDVGIKNGGTKSGVTVDFSWNEINSYIGTKSAGNSQAHNNIQPYCSLNYIIKSVQTTTIVAEVEDSLASDSATNAPSIHAVKQTFDGTVLFEGSSTNGEDIQLNSNPEIYKYIEVFFYRQKNGSSKTCKSVKIIAKNLSVIELSLIWVDGNLNIHSARYQIQTNILKYVNGGFSITTLGTSAPTQYQQPISELTVEKIIGYK